MIYTVTFNPAIDYVMHTGEVKIGETNRSDCEEMYFGGKGINVSYVLSQLSKDNVALGFIAGFTGEALEKGVGEWGVRTDFVHLSEGDTRINIKLKSEKETEINAQGPSIKAEELVKLLEKLDALKSGDTLLLAGSVPKTLPADVYETILARLVGRGVKFVVDATGKLLTNTLKYKPFLIKPNKSELEGIFEKQLSGDDIIVAAQKLREMGAQNVLVSLGPDGAILVDSDGNVHKQDALGGKPVNTVGAGDSMIAGFLAGIEKGPAYALRLGVAAGGATACKDSLATKEDILNLI